MFQERFSITKPPVIATQYIYDSGKAHFPVARTGGGKKSSGKKQ